MDKEPLISVIIPVYNGEKYIRTCLENMLNQSYKNLEIIVINDGSQDRSATISEEYPVLVIHLAQNQGLSAARNIGIDTAKGAYIHFMDVDDTVNPDYYKEMAAAVIKTDADIACGGMWNERYRYKSQRFKKIKVYTSLHGRMKATYVGKFGYVWRYLFKTDFLKKQNLRFEEGRFVEDLIFSFLAVYYADKLVVVPNTTYFYYYWENSISTVQDKAHREKYLRDLMHARTYIRNFAHEHNFKIPGINSDKIPYAWKKFVVRHF